MCACDVLLDCVRVKHILSVFICKILYDLNRIFRLK